ncbi:MAG: hypothetical protein COV55_02765 [Candidatus Komeilibacteria bacterium CG11_big_fil_rev_8_21_14_0_20_36_20]|uniref:Uncharacterized protein n=1 Tax=Candidatus Komeilibacteria bacterium CG11_big_fil_rev_8_21_14_0_20_36_20 TaxID=1974477 RepID=A0A2H0NCN2_9BACT|nr:MAG: hypothetical protein COV55_02765 [Candidatus Komeilibacteria bacterium CG11_big_fil_rev_8_21_14_0_20_36_20]
MVSKTLYIYYTTEYFKKILPKEKGINITNKIIDKDTLLKWRKNLVILLPANDEEYKHFSLFKKLTLDPNHISSIIKKPNYGVINE